MDAATTSVAPVSAAWRWTARATSGSLRSVPSTSAMAACAVASRDRHESSHSRIATAPPSRWRQSSHRRSRTGGTRSPRATGRPTAATDRRRRSARRHGRQSRRTCPAPGEPGRAEQHDALGQRGLRADDGVGGGDRALQPASRQRVGQHGPAQSVGERQTRAGSARCDHGPPAMISPRPCRGSSSSADRRWPAPSRRPRPERPRSDPARRERRGRAGQRLAELEIEVHRAGAVGPCTASSKARTARGLQVSSWPSTGTPGA